MYEYNFWCVGSCRSESACGWLVHVGHWSWDIEISSASALSFCCLASLSHSRFMTGQSKRSFSASAPMSGTGRQVVRELVCRLASASLVLDHIGDPSGGCSRQRNDSFRIERLPWSPRHVGFLFCGAPRRTQRQALRRSGCDRRARSMATADRRGKSTKDYLMQICWFKTVTSGSITLRSLVLRDDQPSPQGKMLWHLWQAMRQFGPALVELGHTGSSIDFFCADRGCYDSM